MNEKNETPRRFGSISVPEKSDFWIWAVNRSRCTILKRNNVAQAQELSYLFASTFKKFIKNINGFFGMKPSSKSQALLQVYIHERTFVYQRKC